MLRALFFMGSLLYRKLKVLNWYSAKSHVCQLKQSSNWRQRDNCFSVCRMGYALMVVCCPWVEEGLPWCTWRAGTQRSKCGIGLHKKCSSGLSDGKGWLVSWEMPLCSVMICCLSVTRLLQLQRRIAPQLPKDHHGCWMTGILELANPFEGQFAVP